MLMPDLPGKHLLNVYFAFKEAKVLEVGGWGGGEMTPYLIDVSLFHMAWMFSVGNFHPSYPSFVVVEYPHPFHRHLWQAVLQ